MVRPLKAQFEAVLCKSKHRTGYRDHEAAALLSVGDAGVIAETVASQAGLHEGGAAVQHDIVDQIVPAMPVRRIGTPGHPYVQVHPFSEHVEYDFFPGFGIEIYIFVIVADFQTAKLIAPAVILIQDSSLAFRPAGQRAIRHRPIGWHILPLGKRSGQIDGVFFCACGIGGAPL